MKRAAYFLSLSLLLVAMGIFASGCKREGTQRETAPARDGGTEHRQMDEGTSHQMGPGNETGTDMGAPATRQPGATDGGTMNGSSGETTTQPSGQTNGGATGGGRNY